MPQTKQPENVQVIKVSRKDFTKKILLSDSRLKERVRIPFNYAYNDIKANAIAYLNSKGITVSYQDCTNPNYDLLIVLPPKDGSFKSIKTGK